MWKKLLQSKILITNWHNLADKTDDNKKGVLKEVQKVMKHSVKEY